VFRSFVRLRKPDYLHRQTAFLKTILCLT